jgi:hypothetical protein
VVLLLGVCSVAQADDAAQKAAALKKLGVLKQGQVEKKTYKSSPKGEANKKLQAIQKMKDAKSALPSESQLAAEPMPEDAYQGSDKAQLLELAEQKWNAQHPDKKILAKGIAMRKWDRKTVWREKPLEPTKKYKVDFSSIQAWVIAKTDDRIATQYIVEISKDHMNKDKFKVYVPKDLKSSGIFKTHMLLKNVK